MPVTGYLPGAPKVMPMTCPPTSKKSLTSRGVLAGGCSSLKKKKNGMSISSLALLDRIIPITNGGISQSSISSMELNLTLSIMIISYVVLVATAKRMQRESSSRKLEFLTINWPTVPNYMLSDCKDNAYERLWTHFWSLTLQRWMQQLVPCVLKWDAETKKPLSASPMQDSHSLPPSQGTTKSTVDYTAMQECMQMYRSRMNSYDWSEVEDSYIEYCYVIALE